MLEGNMVSEILPLLTAYGLKVLGAIVVLIVGMAVAKGIRNGIRKALEKRNVDATLVPFTSKLVYYLMLAFVVLAVLGLFGVQVTSIIAVLGAAAFAVGLALQGTLSNFAAGVMLLIFRPFQVGDVVDTGGVVGSVVEIGLFATRLNSPDNIRIIVPNSSVWGTTIKNISFHETRRNDMVVGVSYSDDLGTAIDVINRILAADERVLEEPAPTVAVSEMADSSVNIVVRPWCKAGDFWSLRFDLNRKLKEELEASGCSIPFPQRDVHLFQASA
jgi:small conductance mechanosensitive channel